MIDHLVYAVADLDEATERLSAQFGILIVTGGSHPGKGTRNALMGLDDRTYLEVISADPEQIDHTGERPFGIDAIIAGDAPESIAAWCAHPPDIDAARTALIDAGNTFGPIDAMSRRKPDGTELAWRLTIPTVAQLRSGIPFLIDWGTSDHPSASLQGPARLSALELPGAAHHVVTATCGPDDRLVSGADTGLRAAISTPTGEHWL